MKKIMRLALVSEDVEYAEAFTEALAATQSGFAVSLVESAESPGAAESDVLILDKTGLDAGGFGSGDVYPEKTPDEIGLLPGGVPSLQTGCRHPRLEIVAGRGAAPVIVDKYAGCSRICAEVKAAYATAHGLEHFAAAGGAGGSACLISFIGVEGGAGASSVALGLAGELSAYRGKKVLYLNFEAFESPLLGAGGRMAARADMSRFLFAFLGEGKGAGVTTGSSRSLGAAVTADSSHSPGAALTADSSRSSGAAVSAEPYLARDDYGVMRFPPFAGLNRIRELRGAELGRFMRDVTGETGADMVIADWGGGLTDEAAEYIGVSAFVVLVTRHGGAKALRAGDDGSPLPYLADELGLDKSRVIVVAGRSPSSGDGEYSDADCPAGYGGSSDADHPTGYGERLDADHPAGYVEICEDPYAFDRDGERISISLATSFGTGVKKLADMVLGTDDEISEKCDAADALFADNGAVDSLFAGGDAVDSLFADDDAEVII